jgi:miniconductance mechanosensitive channel
MDKEYGRLLYNYLLKTGMAEGLATYLNLILLLLGVLVVVLILDLLIWKTLRAISVRVARKSKNNFDNFLVTHRVPRYVAHIVPFVIFLEFIPVAFVDFPYAQGIAENHKDFLCSANSFDFQKVFQKCERLSKNTAQI